MIQEHEREDRLPAPMALGAGMVCASHRNAYQGTGDKRPMVYRQGSGQAAALPSRMGDVLKYPDGRVERVTT